MKYIEAYELIKTGKHIKRLAWDHIDNKNIRLFLLPEAPMVWMTQRSDQVPGGVNCGGYGLTMQDLEADDWMEISTSWEDFQKSMVENVDVSEALPGQLSESELAASLVAVEALKNEAVSEGC